MEGLGDHAPGCSPSASKYTATADSLVSVSTASVFVPSKYCIVFLGQHLNCVTVMVGKAILVFLESIGHMKLSISDHLCWRFACDTEERLRRTAWDVRVVAGDIDKEGFGEESNL